MLPRHPRYRSLDNFFTETPMIRKLPQKSYQDTHACVPRYEDTHDFECYWDTHVIVHSIMFYRDTHASVKHVKRSSNETLIVLIHVGKEHVGK